MTTTARIGRGSATTLPIIALSVACGIALSVGIVLAPDAVLSAIALAVAGIGLTHPVVGVAALMAGATGTLISTAWELPVAAAALVTPLLVIESRRQLKARQLRTPRLLAALVAYLLASWLVAASLRGGSFAPLSLAVLWSLQLAPFLLAYALTRSMDDLNKLLAFFVLLATAVAVTQLLSPTPEGGVVLGSGEISALLTSSRNALGVLYLLAISIVLPRIRLPPRPRDVALMALAIVLSLATAGGLSRSSYIGGAALAATFLLIRGSKAGAVVLLLVVIGIPFATGGEISTLDEAAKRVIGTLGTGGLDASSAVRLDLWSAAWRAFEQNPVFGLGYQQFSAHLAGLWEGSVSGLAVASRSEGYAYAHNLYLTVLSQGGLIGACIFGAVIASLVRDARHAEGAFRETAWLALAGAGAASAFGEPLLVMAVAVPFLLINAAARMSARSRV
jgi:O-antigen ligase